MRAGGRAVLCQVDRRRWLSLEGTPKVLSDPAAVADAEQAYAARYRIPRVNPTAAATLTRTGATRHCGVP